MRFPLFFIRTELIPVTVHALLNQLIDHEEEISATCDALSELDWSVYSLHED